VNELKSTREYRTDLERSLARAQARLSHSDFEAMAIGIRCEMTRLDAEIDNLRLRSFVGSSTSEPIVPRVIRLLTTSGLKVRAKEQSAIGTPSEFTNPVVDEVCVSTIPVFYFGKQKVSSIDSGCVALV
jgi:hypothetical protein